MSKIEWANQINRLGDLLRAIEAHAWLYEDASICCSINRPPVVHWDLGPYRRLTRGKVVTYTIEITEPGDPIAEMLQADEEKKGWEYMLRASASD